MRKVRTSIIILLLVLAFAASVLAQVSPRFDLSWSLLSGGGGSRESAVYQLDDVLGQWADGRSVSTRYQVDPGFWHTGRVLPQTRLYLPVVQGR